MVYGEGNCLGCIDEGTNVARPVTVNIPHKLGKQEARRRIEEGFGRLRQQMTGGVAAMVSFQERWDGERLVTHLESVAPHRVLARYDEAMQPVVRTIMAERPG